MKKTLFILFIAGLLGACCNNPKSTGTTPLADSTQVTASISIDSFLTAAPALLGKVVTVHGTADHICKHGGKRIKLVSTATNQSIHGEATDQMGAFKAELEGNDVCITGTVAASKMDMAYVDEYEAGIKEAMEKEKSEAEMDHKEGVDHHADLEKIKQWKEAIQASDSGFIPTYYIEVSSCHEYKASENGHSCCQPKESAEVADAKKAGAPCCGDKKEVVPCEDNSAGTAPCESKK